jgi:DNA-directed RNA polymerase specialized sigma24 family protein
LCTGLDCTTRRPDLIRHRRANVPGMTAEAQLVFDGDLEAHRGELTAFCYRMLGSPFEAEDAVQETLIRAWRAFERFEGRSSIRTWLYKIAGSVCFDMLRSRKRRAIPMDLGGPGLGRDRLPHPWPIGYG